MIILDTTSATHIIDWSATINSAITFLAFVFGAFIPIITTWINNIRNRKIEIRQIINDLEKHLKDLEYEQCHTYQKAIHKLSKIELSDDSKQNDNTVLDVFFENDNLLIDYKAEQIKGFIDEKASKLCYLYRKGQIDSINKFYREKDDEEFKDFLENIIVDKTNILKKSTDKLAKYRIYIIDIQDKYIAYLYGKLKKS